MSVLHLVPADYCSANRGIDSWQITNQGHKTGTWSDKRRVHVSINAQDWSLRLNRPRLEKACHSRPVTHANESCSALLQAEIVSDHDLQTNGLPDIKTAETKHTAEAWLSLLFVQIIVECLVFTTRGCN